MADYYSLLGVPRNASHDELKSAFREKALENHPDRISHLPAGERKQREDLMYQVNEAWGVLSKPEKKREYDQLNPEQSRPQKTSEGATRTQTTSHPPQRPVSYEDLFSSIFKDSGIFGGKDIFGSAGSYGDFFGKQTKTESYFMIPENDWGLLAALKKAYESEEDGKWRVQKVETDKRDFVPDEIYSVKKENGKVTVFRKITDWRSESDRKREIQVRKEGSYFDYEKMDPDTFLGEYYFSGEGRNRLTESYKIPYSFGEYIQSLKSLAKKFATKETDKDGKYDVKESEVMNRYGQYGSNNTRVEGGLFNTLQDREWVKKVPFDDFWKRMKQAEGQVRLVEWTPKTKEGASKPQQQGGSGENLG